MISIFTKLKFHSSIPPSLWNPSHLGVRFAVREPSCKRYYKLCRQVANWKSDTPDVRGNLLVEQRLKRFEIFLVALDFLNLILL